MIGFGLELRPEFSIVAALPAVREAGALGTFRPSVAALAFTLARPERVRRLVLANTASGEPAFRRAGRLD
jgi:pimeloyl-ACP methyl ester carboxylesterase